MNPGYHLTSFTLLEKFNFISDRLAENPRNANLNEAIISWCIELSIEKYFPKASQEIINNKDLWLKQNTVRKNTLELYRRLLVVTDRRITRGIGNSLNRFNRISGMDFYRNIIEVKQEMNVKLIVFIAFIFTGVGLLLYLLNKKNAPRSQSQTKTVVHSNYVIPIEEKYTLVLLIKSDRYQDLIYSLKDSKRLKPEDASKLYGATQGLWIETKSEFDKSQIKRELVNNNSVTTTSEYDIHFVIIELDEDDSRFNRDVNPMDRRDAFIELGERSPRIKVSPRLSCKAYENTEFYSR